MRNRHARRGIRSAALGLAVALALAACGGSEPTTEPTDTEEPTAAPTDMESTEPMEELEPKSLTEIMAVVVPTHPNFIYLTGPATLGFWEDMNLDVTIEFTDGSAQGTQALLGGRGDLVIAGGAVSLYGPHSQGEDTIAFYNTAPGQFSYPVVPEDSPITNLADLAGGEKEQIGVVSLTTGSIQLFNAMAKAEGLTPDDYEFLPVGTGAAAATALFESQDIDILMLWADQYAIIEGVDEAYQMRQLSTPIAEAWGVATPAVTTQEKMDADPEVYARWARGVAMTSVFVQENPDAAAAIHSACYPESLPTSDSPEAAQELAKNILLARFTNSMNIANVNGIDRWGEFPEEFILAYHRDIGSVDSPDFDGDPLELYTNDLIDSINDFDEEAVREYARNWSDADFDEAITRCPS